MSLLIGLPLLCSKLMFYVVSCDIPTLKSWFVWWESFIPAEGSWTLRKFGRLLPSEEESVKESESLLLMPPGSHSIMSQYHTQIKKIWN